MEAFNLFHANTALTCLAIQNGAYSMSSHPNATKFFSVVGDLDYYLVQKLGFSTWGRVLDKGASMAAVFPLQYIPKEDLLPKR